MTTVFFVVLFTAVLFFSEEISVLVVFLSTVTMGQRREVICSFNGSDKNMQMHFKIP